MGGGCEKGESLFQACMRCGRQSGLVNHGTDLDVSYAGLLQLHYTGTHLPSCLSHETLCPLLHRFGSLGAGVDAIMHTKL